MQTLGEHETGALNQNTSESPFKTLKPVKVHFFPNPLPCLQSQSFKLSLLIKNAINYLISPF